MTKQEKERIEQELARRELAKEETRLQSEQQSKQVVVENQESEVVSVVITGEQDNNVVLLEESSLHHVKRKSAQENHDVVITSNDEPNTETEKKKTRKDSILPKLNVKFVKYVPFLIQWLVNLFSTSKKEMDTSTTSTKTPKARRFSEAPFSSILFPFCFHKLLLKNIKTN
jgi:hypothetical protein